MHISENKLIPPLLITEVNIVHIIDEDEITVSVYDYWLLVIEPLQHGNYGLGI